MARLGWLRDHVRTSWNAAALVTADVVAWEAAVMLVSACVDPPQRDAAVAELDRRRAMGHSLEFAQQSLLEDIAMDRWPEPPPVPLRRRARRRPHIGPFWRCWDCTHWCDEPRRCCICYGSAP